MIDLLKQRGGENIKVFGGGGGVIVPAEMKELHDYGVAHLYSVEDGQKMGLQGMINDMVQRCDHDLSKRAPQELKALEVADRAERLRNLAQIITALENGAWPEKAKKALLEKVGAGGTAIPVVGITGTGGAGKSSLTDELIRRFRLDQDDSQKIAVISIDPSRKRTGGALLGDRIRMNAIQHPNIYMRSLATRDTGSEISKALPDVIAACKVAGFDLIVVETSGIGQGDAAIVPLVDVSLYVMTPEFGAASQLEKIDMLDFADFVAINKFDRKGAEDALRDVRKQYQRNRERFGEKPDDMPVFGTMAARFNDDGVTALYQALVPRLAERGLKFAKGRLPAVTVKASSAGRAIVPADRVRYLAEIADTLRGYHRHIGEQATLARERQSLRTAKAIFEGCKKNANDFDELIAWKDGQLTPHARKLLAMWPDMKKAYAGDEYVVKIRDKEIRTGLVSETLSGTKIRKVVLPRFDDEGELLKFLMRENVPGSFPYTAGVFAFKRENEDPTRMFAGEGDAFRTNKRFLKVSEGMPAKRLSTAFDSVTLYGCDPDPRPDIYGKVGNSGVSIATLDDLKVLYSGFDLCDPATSVSMTINGPAPMILAMFLNAAIDQQIAKFVTDNGRQPTEDEAEKIREWTLSSVRGTVQADILKEDQGQNTCIFSTEFALKMMGDIAEFFVHNQIRNFYSVSISGYHIAEAGANPISQLAFTLANGFTYVETYLARGMHIDDFAPNLSFFFSNGMDPEYSVIGRVARRIWAVAMKNKYGANERSQKLKYHIQTSGRSLHAQEMDFNDIRTTLQALIAIYDNCNSLHTNAYDEAITTPTEESVRRAMAIQLIINREWGVAKNENPNQGAFVIEELTDLVEEAVLKEFEAIASTWRRARRHGNRLPARQDPGRVDALRAQEARRLLPHHRRQYLPQSARLRRRQRDRAGALDRGRKAVAVQAPGRFPAAQRRAGRGLAGEAAPGGDRQRQRLRRDDGSRAPLLAGADRLATIPLVNALYLVTGRAVPATPPTCSPCGRHAPCSGSNGGAWSAASAGRGSRAGVDNRSGERRRRGGHHQGRPRQRIRRTCGQACPGHCRRPRDERRSGHHRRR
jgi:methylmalonyl-CoA mutase